MGAVSRRQLTPHRPLVQAAAITAPNSKMSMNPLRPVHNWC